MPSGKKAESEKCQCEKQSPSDYQNRIPEYPQDSRDEAIRQNKQKVVAERIDEPDIPRDLIPCFFDQFFPAFKSSLNVSAANEDSWSVRLQQKVFEVLL